MKWISLALLLVATCYAVADTIDGARLTVVNAPIARQRLGIADMIAGTNNVVIGTNGVQWTNIMFMNGLTGYVSAGVLYIGVAGSVSGGGGTTNFLLLQTGDFVLLQTGGKVRLQ